MRQRLHHVVIAFRAADHEIGHQSPGKHRRSEHEEILHLREALLRTMATSQYVTLRRLKRVKSSLGVREREKEGKYSRDSELLL